MSIKCDDEVYWLCHNKNWIINIYLLPRISFWETYTTPDVLFIGSESTISGWTYFGLWQSSRLLHIDWNIGGSPANWAMGALNRRTAGDVEPMKIQFQRLAFSSHSQPGLKWHLLRPTPHVAKPHTQQKKGRNEGESRAQEYHVWMQRPKQHLCTVFFFALAVYVHLVASRNGRKSQHQNQHQHQSPNKPSHGAKQLILEI